MAIKMANVEIVAIKVKNYIVRHRVFTIVKFDNDMYGAIEDKYVDENGELNTQLNGIQMHIGNTVAEVVDRTNNDVEVEYLVSNGYTLGQALCTVYNIPMEKADAIDEISA